MASSSSSGGRAKGWTDTTGNRVVHHTETSNLKRLLQSVRDTGDPLDGQLGWIHHGNPNGAEEQLRPVRIEREDLPPNASHVQFTCEETAKKYLKRPFQAALAEMQEAMSGPATAIERAGAVSRCIWQHVRNADADCLPSVSSPMTAYAFTFVLLSADSSTKLAGLDHVANRLMNQGDWEDSARAREERAAAIEEERRERAQSQLSKAAEMRTEKADNREEQINRAIERVRSGADPSITDHGIRGMKVLALQAELRKRGVQNVHVDKQAVCIGMLMRIACFEGAPPAPAPTPASPRRGGRRSTGTSRSTHK